MKRAVLPCNGLDKAVGMLAREVALRLIKTEDAEIICPVLLNNSPARYEKALAEVALIVIDGCPTRCATKLANKLGLKIDDKVLVSEQAKSTGLNVSESLQPGPVGMQLVEIIADGLLAAKEAPGIELPISGFGPPTQFLSVTHDKYVFKIPVAGFLFNENDCWVQAVGNRARIGISDFVQQNLTDITYFEPARVGVEIEQFDEVGALESGKSMMDVLSPVSGQIVAVNSQLADTPELANEDPYGKGWIVEIELRDFESDKELLLDAQAYCKIVEKKAAEAY